MPLFPSDADRDRSVVRMCEYGAKLIGQGHYESIRFELFNYHEEEIVKRTMAERFPKVAYVCDVLFPRPRERCICPEGQSVNVCPVHGDAEHRKC